MDLPFYVELFLAMIWLIMFVIILCNGHQNGDSHFVEHALLGACLGTISVLHFMMVYHAFFVIEGHF